MTPLRIGIAPVTLERSGGTYQYSNVMLDALAQLRDEQGHEVVVFANGIDESFAGFGPHRFELHDLYPPSFRNRVRNVVERHARRWLSPDRREVLFRLAGRARPANSTPRIEDVVERPEVSAWLRRFAPDLMLYPAPIPLAFEAGVPYVMAVHDLQHRLHPEFPEVSADGEYERREYLYANGISRALVVLTDSEVGREDVLTLYDGAIAPERVAILPFLPATPAQATRADIERVRAAYGLPERYLFYPAQFWAHKNHVRLVEALALLQGRDVTVDLVLVGSTGGELRRRRFAEIVRRAEELGVRARLHHPGYVPDEDVAPLYAGAVALVMPTFFGPTNIPILEAWGLGCPVITSNIRGVREQAGDAALLADPESVEAIADAVQRLWLEPEVGRTLAERGRRRLAAYSAEAYRDRLGDVLQAAGGLIGRP